MALSTEEAAVNTAADTYLAAIDSLLDGLTVGARVLWVPIAEHAKVASTSTDPAPPGGAGQLTTTSMYIPVTTGGVGNNQSNKFAFGGGLLGNVLGFTPICWKVTNDAGALT